MTINLTPRATPPASGGRGDWMQTHSGRAFYPLDPRPDEIYIDDIGHALSMLCRYNGHVSRFYSVAEHSYLLSRAVDPEHALWALLHDASEAYLGDMIRPLKNAMARYRAVETQVMRAITDKYGLDALMPAQVKEYDTRILVDERDALMQDPPQAWFAGEKVEKLDVPIEGWNPTMARARFLFRFDELVNG